MQREKEIRRGVFLAAVCLVMAFIILLPERVLAETTGFYEWKTINGGKEVEITKYTGGEQVAKIPSKLDGKPVTSIGVSAFSENKFIEQVEIPDTVNHISVGAFDQSGLKSIKIPDSVTSIYDWAFNGCENLETIDFGDGIEELGNICERCPKLKNVRIGKRVKVLHDTFQNDTGLASITIPGNVKRIDAAFNGCTGLTSVDLQEGIEVIGRSAFARCGLRSVKLPDSLTSLSYVSGYSFSECKDLVSVTIGRGLDAVADDTFRDCTSLTSIVIPSNVRWIGSDAFWGCKALARVDFAKGLENIGSSGFGYCPSLTEVILPGTLTGVEGNAFNGNDNLKTVTIPKSVTEIGDYAFEKDVTVRGWSGSYAEKYASKNKLAFTALPDVPATSFVVDQAAVQMKIGDTYSLSYTLSPSDTTDTVLWESSDKEIVDVTALGKLIAENEGSVNIIATTSNGIRRTLTVVVQPAPKTMTFAKTKVSVQRGKTYTQTAKLENGRTDFAVSYESSDSSVASVDAKSGEVTAKKVGTATITASISTGLKASYTITVTEPAKIKFTQSKLTIGVKERVGLKIKPSAKVAYTSSRPDVASVTGSGKVTGKKTGKAVITAKASDGRAAKCTVTVKKAPKKLKLSKTTLTLKRGKSYTLKPKFTGGSYSYKITWKSSKRSVATVNSKGKVVAKKKGDATITAKTFNGKKAVCRVTVK
ncbi:MAG TPA: hypothetical protein DF613_10060 [Lachnospiraceae bacterium]|nr:hypothetical protein [Lachnospiraceae bacterium]